ncbi:MAG: helix-turn-helix domain-containing protein [Deltaproteobacteria bacterium]|nr:helix-turn-helix domain-containing protein [Deltaproteobacteria bacterium]
MESNRKYVGEIDPKKLGARIAQLADMVGGKRKLSQETGIKEPQLYRYIRGTNQPTVNVLLSLAIVGNVTLDWLITGKGTIKNPGSHRSSQIDGAEYMAIPVLTERDVQTTARRTIQFPTEWVPSSKNKEYYLVKQLGDSMEPTIKVGDFVLVEGPASDLVRDGLYVIKAGDHYLIKRIQIIPPGVARFTNDNRNYNDFELVESNGLDNVSIVGKVVWAGKYF